jgi:RNA polymerase sigma factor (sigma-70 family)
MLDKTIDERIVDLLKRKDVGGVRLFMDTYAGFMFHVCNKVLMNTPEAEEATQDAVLKIMNAIDTFNEGSSFKAWCYTISYRTSIDYKRKSKIHTDIAVVHDLADGDTADALIKIDETKESVQSLLKHIDDESRLIISLFYLEEKNIKEVVDITGLTESNVKIKLFRARKELAKHANKYFDTYSV